MTTRLLALLVGTLCLAVPAFAQGRLAGPDAQVYGGVGIGKGVGVTLVGASPVLDLFTREASLGLVFRPGEGDESSRLVGSAGIGVGLRLLRVASVARSRGIPTGDLDIGLRVGPSFSAALGTPTDGQRARAFAVFADPFVRASRRVRGREAFAELGTHAPMLRVGLTSRLGSQR
jgi:hypothetical protein